MPLSTSPPSIISMSTATSLKLSFTIRLPLSQICSYPPLSASRYSTPMAYPLKTINNYNLCQ